MSSVPLTRHLQPFSTLLYARMGNGVATNQLFKMIAGAVKYAVSLPIVELTNSLSSPGKPVANLYFSMWSHDVVSQSIGMAQDLKMGQVNPCIAITTVNFL